jgi:hypothetical protein
MRAGPHHNAWTLASGALQSEWRLRSSGPRTPVPYICGARVPEIALWITCCVVRISTRTSTAVGGSPGQSELASGTDRSLTVAVLNPTVSTAG